MSIRIKCVIIVVLILGLLPDVSQVDTTTLA